MKKLILSLLILLSNVVAATEDHNNTLFMTGLRNLSDDEAKGMQLINQSALNGHAPAQYFLSKLYMYGYFVAKDKAEERRLYILAKEGGYANPKRRTIYLGADFGDPTYELSPLVYDLKTSFLKSYTPLSVAQTKYYPIEASNDPEALAEAVLNRQFHLIAAHSSEKERLREYSITGVKEKTKESLRLYKHCKRLGYPAIDDIARVQTLLHEPFDHAVIGLCPANRYFSSLNIEKLIRWSLETFKRITFFIPYRWAQYTYKGEHIANNKAIDEKSAAKRTNDSANDVYKQLIIAIDNLLHDPDLNPADRTAIEALKSTLPLYIKGKPFTPKEAITEQFEVRLGCELEKTETYQEMRQYCLEQYSEDLHLREVCRQMVRTLLNKRTGKVVTQDAVDMAVEYILHELPLFFGSTKLFGTPSSFNIYHEMADYVPFIPEDTNQGFLCVDITEQSHASSSGACCSSSSSSETSLPRYSSADDLSPIAETLLDSNEELISLLTSIPDDEKETFVQLLETYAPFLDRVKSEYEKTKSDALKYIDSICAYQPIDVKLSHFSADEIAFIQATEFYKHDILLHIKELYTPLLKAIETNFSTQKRLLIKHIAYKTPSQRKNTLHIRKAFASQLQQFTLFDEDNLMRSIINFHDFITNQPILLKNVMMYAILKENILIESISNLPEHEQAPILTLALPYILGIKYACAIPYFFKSIEAIPDHDRENVLSFAAPLMTRKKLDTMHWPPLIDTIASIPLHERAVTIDATLALSKNVDLYQRLNLLNTIRLLPAERLSAFLVAVAPHTERLQKSLDKAIMIAAVSNLDPNKIDRVLTAAMPFISNNEFGIDEACLIQTISFLQTISIFPEHLQEGVLEKAKLLSDENDTTSKKTETILLVTNIALAEMLKAIETHTAPSTWHN